MPYATLLHPRRMRIFRIVFLLSSILIVFICGCKRTTAPPSINLLENQSVSISDIFESVNIIPLERTEESLIAMISQVVYFKERFYVLDTKQQKIFCFDKNGRFISEIAQQGHGPGEYVYASGLTVDVYNMNLIILSPPSQELLVVDLEGNFIKKLTINTEIAMGLNKVFALNDSTLLVSSLTDYQLIFYNAKKESVTKTDFPIPVFIPQLMPLLNIYEYNGSVFVNPNLSSKVYEITETTNKNHYAFDYGLLNNTERQKSLLQDYFRNSTDNNSIRMHELLQSNGYLKHYLIKVMESKRFIMKWVAIENSIKHVIIDKNINETFVFDFFEDDVVFNMQFDVHQDRYLIAFETRYFKDEESNKEFFGPWYPFFISDFVNANLLNQEDIKIVEEHDPLVDNPYLVLYKFRE